MLSTDFEGSNIRLHAEDCNDLMAFKGDLGGYVGYEVAFKASYEDIQALNANLPVIIQFAIDFAKLVFVRVSTRKFDHSSGFMNVPRTFSWAPSRNDMRLIENGGAIYIGVVGQEFPPIKVWTLNKEGTPNE